MLSADSYTPASGHTDSVSSPLGRIQYICFCSQSLTLVTAIHQVSISAGWTERFAGHFCKTSSGNGDPDLSILSQMPHTPDFDDHYRDITFIIQNDLTCSAPQWIVTIRFICRLDQEAHLANTVSTYFYMYWQYTTVTDGAILDPLGYFSNCLCI